MFHVLHKLYEIWFVAVENSTKDGLIKRTTSMLRTVLEDLESPHSVLQAESSASMHNPSRFCQHYLNVLVHYISY